MRYNGLPLHDVREIVLNLEELCVRPIQRGEERRYQELMHAHHYLGSLPKIGETLWYVATWGEEWVALLGFSAAAWKCAVRDRWIGWEFRHQYDRLDLVANNSRFLILPQWHRPNLGSKTLSLCQRRLGSDWVRRFGHPLVLLETFVDPERFQGTVYRAANWVCLGETQGFRRTRQGYSPTAQPPKRVFVKPLQADARRVLSRPLLDTPYRTGVPKIMLSAEQMRTYPSSLPTSPIRAAPKGDAIRCRWFWPSPPERPSAACAATKPSRTGPKVSAPRPESGSVAAVKAGATACRANRSSAIVSSVSIPSISMPLCNAGMRSMARPTRASPSMARPCAMPSMPKATRPTS